MRPGLGRSPSKRKQRADLRKMQKEKLTGLIANQMWRKKKHQRFFISITEKLQFLEKQSHELLTVWRSVQVCYPEHLDESVQQAVYKDISFYNSNLMNLSQNLLYVEKNLITISLVFLGYRRANSRGRGKLGIIQLWQP